MSKIPYISGLKVSGQVELKNLVKNNDPYRILTLDSNNNVNWCDYTISSSGGTGGGDYYTKGQSDSKFLSLVDYDWYSLPSKPTLLSQFTNNLGNYGNWITADEGSLVFQPLEDQRLSRNRDVRFASITSTAYSSGAGGTGFRIDGFGNAEFTNLTVRNVLNLNEFKVNKITASNGSLAITDGIVIQNITDQTTTYKCSIKTDSGNIAVPFQVDDLVKCQTFNGRGVKYYLRKVTAVGSDYFNLAKVAIDGTDTPEPLDEVVRFGNTSNVDRQGLIYLTASDSNAPYLDVLDGVDSDDLSGKTKVRLGKLDGIIDANFGALDGYGLYAENAYIKGTINVTGGNAQTIAGSQALTDAASTILQAYTNSQIAIASGATLQDAYNNSVSLSNSAQAAAEIAANAYSDIVSNSAASAVEIAAAANALAVANAKRDEAIAASATALTTFANTLGSLSYENQVSLAMLGNTIISGGYLANTLIDTVYLKAAIINASQIIIDGGGATVTYVDGVGSSTYSSAVSQATTLAAAAQSASETYTNLHAAYEREVAKSYSDGIVDTEEAARLAEAAAKLAEAKGYSDTVSASAQAAAISSANATSLAYTNSQIAISEASVLSTAASTAQSKADAAYTASVAASATYSVTVSNASATQAEINAAATASDLATTAYNNAVAQAAAAQAALTSSLKSLAYQELSDLAVGGQTLISGGKINTVLLDVLAIQANVVTADYVNTLSLVTTNIAATTGTIADWTISTDKLYAGNSSTNYIELRGSSNPELYMKNSSQISGEYSSINSNGLYISSAGNTLNITNWGSYKAVGAFKLKSASVATDVALFASAPSAATALWVEGKTYISSTLSVASTLQAQSLIVTNGANISGGIYVNGGAIINNITNKSTAGGTTSQLWVATSGANLGRIYLGSA